MFSSGCFPAISGAPCVTNDNCPTGQVSVANKCESGTSGEGGGSGKGGGSGQGGGVGQGGGSGGGGGDGGGAGGGGPAKPEQLCADGVDNDGDMLFDCEDPDCDLKECRSAASVCDVAETCKAMVCPTDEFAANTVQCRPAVAGALCDVADFCTGSSADCPADGVEISGKVCRPNNSTEKCDVEEVCDGTSPACPVDGFAAITTSCRASAGICDVEEFCTGTNAACPTDGFDKSGLICRPPAGLCDVPDKCSGTSAACPTDAVLPATTVCRGVAGACDFEEKCTGTNPQCPTDLNGCSAAQFCQAGACVAKFANGQTCTDAAQCGSGNCVDGFCCNTSCTGECKSCNGATPGTCTNFALNTDPQTECAAFTCNGSGACLTACNGGSCSLNCKAGAYCSVSGACTADRANGLGCTLACECASGACNSFFKDADGDLYGSATTAKFCGTAAPVGYATNAMDCCDTDAKARPGAGAQVGARFGCGGWDYNCDGAETKTYTASLACQSTGACGTGMADCTGTVGWVSLFSPACGAAAATYVTKCSTATACSPFTCPGCLRCVATTRTLEQTCK